MKTEIFSKDYITYYEVCNWNPELFGSILNEFGYSTNNNLIVNTSDDDWNDLDFRDNNNIKILPFIKHITGSLLLEDSSIESLGSLTYVGGVLLLDNCENIRTLGNLEKVGGHLSLENCTKLSDLGNLKYVGDNLYIKNTKYLKNLAKKYIYKILIDNHITKNIHIDNDISYG